MTRITHHLKRHGLLMLVLAMGLFVYLATSDVGAALMFAALAYIGGSVIQEAARHRWLKINGAWWVLVTLCCVGVTAAVHHGDATWLVIAPALALLGMVVPYLLPLLSGPWPKAVLESDYLSFEDYKRLHPSHIGNGRVSCFSCEGTGIAIRRVGYVGFDIVNSHVCRQCGSELYRTKTSQ